MNRVLGPLLVLVLVSSVAPKISLGGEPKPGKACRQHPLLSGRCFNLRGRLALYNGTPSLRIWPLRSQRLLGISEGRFALPNYANIPPGLVEQLGGFDNEMFADFRVCPFTDDKPGVMRLICVDAATQVAVRRKNQPAPRPH